MSCSNYQNLGGRKTPAGPRSRIPVSSCDADTPCGAGVTAGKAAITSESHRVFCLVVHVLVVTTTYKFIAFDLGYSEPIVSV